MVLSGYLYKNCGYGIIYLIEQKLQSTWQLVSKRMQDTSWYIIGKYGMLGIYNIMSNMIHNEKISNALKHRILNEIFQNSANSEIFIINFTSGSLHEGIPVVHRTAQF